MKLNTTYEMIFDRINTFEKKLRIITGLERDQPFQPPLMPDTKAGSYEIMHESQLRGSKKTQVNKCTGTQNEDQGRQVLYFKTYKKWMTDFSDAPKYLHLRQLYEKKIAANTFGIY
jgi:hypothetical protein